MNKNYNIERERLYLPEYGRHIHKMVENLMSIENRNERNQKAKIVIDVIGNLNPLLRDTPEFTHKLWDHLFIMSDFKLDVDSPYPKPSRSTLTPIPHNLSYPDHRIEMKHYGKYVRRIIRSLDGIKSSEEAKEVVNDVARYMRIKAYEFNQEHPDNEAIIRDIQRMSKNGVAVDENAIASLKNSYKTSVSEHQNRGSKQKKNDKNGRNNSQRRKNQH